MEALKEMWEESLEQVCVLTIKQRLGVSHKITSIHKLLYPPIYLWLYSPLLDLGCFFSFLILYTVSRTP
jgi:hypothetical protein